MIQPILVPCNRRSADLSICPCPDRADHVQVWWGLALLHTVPRDPSDPVTRGFIAMLALARYHRNKIAMCFGICRKTVIRIAREFNTGRLRLAGEVSGAVPEPIIQFLRVSYRDILDANGGRHVHGTFEDLRRKVLHIWNLPLSHEYVRVLLTECRDSWNGPADGGASEPESPADAGPSSDPQPTCSSGVPETVACDHLATPACGAVEAAVPLFEPLKSGDLSHPEHADGTGGGISDNGEPRVNASATGFPGDRLPEGTPVFLDHVGHLLLSPWFEEVFGGLAPILRQTGCQILQGAVNQESSRTLNHSSLSLLLGSVCRNPAHQRNLLDRLVETKARETVIRRNIAALMPKLGPSPEFYYDPHPEKYTGDWKIIRTWNGALKRVEPSILHDFVHTSDGCPVMAGLFDGFHEPRERFLMVREALSSVLPEEARIGIVWIQDRGFWGENFHLNIVMLGDFFIQWEKGWETLDETVPVVAEGEHVIVRFRNNPGDVVEVRLRWKTQPWKTDVFPKGRRVVVFREKSKAVSIVDTACHLSPERIIELMFGRWNQEGDFVIENRHFGLHELTSRKFVPYSEVADETTDREVPSREAKRLNREIAETRAKLGSVLIHLSGMQPITLETIQKRRERIELEIDEVEKRMAALPRTGQLDPDRHGGIIEAAGSMLKDIARRLRMTERQKDRATEYERRRTEKRELKERLAELRKELSETDRTESKMLIMLEENYSTPDLRRKRLVDAIRISCRNIFHRIVDELRQIYHNHREDHETLRALLRASGWAVRKGRRIEVVLMPRMTREPAEWRRIRTFLNLCQERFLKTFDVEIRFVIQLTNAQIMDFLARNDKRKNCENQKKWDTANWI